MKAIFTPQLDEHKSYKRIKKSISTKKVIRIRWKKYKSIGRTVKFRRYYRNK